MSERNNILEKFRENEDYVNDRVKNGIENNRKGYAHISVIDKNGEPVKNAQIKVVQKNHKFKHGANLFMLDELESEEKNKKYKDYFKDAFNIATVPFYWSDLEPERGKPRYDKDSPKVYRRPAPDLCIEFCEKNGIEPREHALAYDHFFPEWLDKNDVIAAKKELERRYAEISQRYADKIPTIEVTNETFWPQGKTALYEENDFVEYCFKLAEKYFPHNKLSINEYSGVWCGPIRNRVYYYSQIERAIRNGARIDAVGMQYHMFNRLEDEYKATREHYDPVRLFNVLDKYSEFGLPIQITEVTIPAYTQEAEDEELQAEIIKQLYSIWFSHKNVEQIIYWNLVDGYAAFAKQGDMASGENYYRGGLIRFDFTPKPAYYMVKDLFTKEWITNADVVTDDAGKCGFKGFYGEYDVEIIAGGKKFNEKLNLDGGKCKEFNFSLDI